ncbi:MAG: hypothetical protein IPM06_19565 [Rhizobiales bacterium]|nr:hypothetical protein [Hyphomicrobiales bacterium]
MTDIRFSDLCHFEPKQWQATEAADTHRYTLFGGSRGPGKSYFLRWYAVRRLLMWAAQGHSGVRVMIGSEDYPALWERHISKAQTEYPAWLGAYHVSRNEFRLDQKWGGGVIAFRNLDDASKYMSSEFAGMCIDELAKNSQRTFDLLRGSLRWPGIEDVFFVGASNPAANWVRDYWISRQLPPELESAKGQFAFVPALPDDNPHLDKSYWAMLDTLPTALREAWKLGNWFAAVEGLVYETFSADNITDEEPNPEIPIELAIDDGYSPDPRATLFIQRYPDHILVFDELYQYKVMEERTVIDIKERCDANGWPVPELAVVSHEAPALRERLRRADIPARNWLAAKNMVQGERSKRVAAIKHTRSLLCDGQGYRTIRIHRRCRALLDEITSGYKYPEGKHTVDDFPADGNDHSCNALESYVFMRVRTP